MAKRKAGAKALVIVESPAKARTIAKYLGDEFVVKASMGHVRDLPPQDFGIDINSGFKPTYEVVRGRGRVISDLKRIADKADAVYLATDRDREGEAIAWHLAEALGLSPARIRRVIFNEITRSAITEAFTHPHKIDFDRVNAQQARRILDRIVGYELSPLLWRKIARGLSAGRVQSVVVRLIVEREREISAFVPQESWKITAYVSGDAAAVGGGSGAAWKRFRQQERTQKETQQWLAEHGAFRTELAEVAGKPFEATDAEAARAVVEALGFAVERVERRPWADYRHLGMEQVELVGELSRGRAPELVVSDFSTKRTTTRPPAPFTTATLQQQASTALRFSNSRTMRVAQSLYEGVDLNGEGPVGLITYMRTDSTNLANEAVQAVRVYIRSAFGDRYLPQKPNVFGRRQARAQEAHEAIRPTDAALEPSKLHRTLSQDQYKLYELIWKRFVACQMTPAQWDSTSVSVSCETSLGTARFGASGRKLVFDGFMKVAGVSRGDQLLPALERGQSVGLLELEPKQQFSSPSPRYSEASLVKALESEGIGRPSTYATIIETIQQRGYVEQEERKFRPTALGELVTDKLVAHFPKIMDVKFTSHMEDELDKIEEAELDWVRVLHEFYDPFADMMARAGDEMETVRGQPSDQECPQCGSPMVYRWSKAGRFLACTKYPECKGTLDVDREGNPRLTTAHVCAACGRPMVLREARGGHFLGCSGYPECRETVACDGHGEPLRVVEEEELTRPCDACDGKMTVKWKGRRAFLGCDQYPKCKNTGQIPPDVQVKRKPAPPPQTAGIPCEKCGRPMVIRKGRRGKFIACSGFPRCRNTKPIDGLEELKAAAAQAGDGVVAGQAEPPAGFAWTRTGRPVVEVMPEEGKLVCPECGGVMELKRGRFGPFFSCGGYPRCKFVSNLRGAAKKQAEELLPAPNRPQPQPTKIPCEECGEPMVIREGRRGRFLGCGAYPKCQFTRELPVGAKA